MRVTVNGEQREITSASVDALLSELDGLMDEAAYAKHTA